MVIEVIKETFNLEEVPDDLSQENYADWDSLGHLQLIINLERKLGKRFPIQVVTKLTSIDKIMEAING
jgi:acyl carrier protein